MYTEQGQVIGTPEYMSPEQTEFEQHDIDTRTDIYSLGIVLYELLVGALPLDPRELRRAAFNEVCRKIREEVPSRPSARLSTLGERSNHSADSRRTDPRGLARQLRGDLDWITMKALEKDRSRRYDTAGDFQADIGRYMRGEPVSAGPPGMLYRAGKFAGRHWIGICVLAAAFALLAVVAVRESVQARQIATERDTARQVSDFVVALFEVSGPDKAMGETVTAREILDRGAEKVDKELDGRPLVQGRMMTVLGTIYHKLGLYQQADDLLLRSFETLSSENGANHPDTLRAMHERAMLIQNRGSLEEAERLAREVVERYRDVLGNDHPETLMSYGTLAGTLRARDRLEEAETYILAEVEGLSRILGPDHQDTLVARNNYAGLLYSRAKYPEAEEQYRELLSVMRDQLGNDHPRTLYLIHNVGAVIEVQKRFQEAEPFYREALDGRRRILGDDHPDSLLSLTAMAKINQRQGRLKVAEPLARKALAGHRRVLGDDHPMTLFALNTLAWVMWDQDKFSEAESLFRKILDRSVRKLGEEHQSTIRARSYLAAVLWEQNRYGEAEQLFLEAIDGALSVLGIEHSHTRSVLTDLVLLYEEWDKPAKAAELREKYSSVFHD